MARAGGEKVRELEDVLREAAGRLSPAHVTAPVAHPDAVRSADVLIPDDEARPRIETIAGAEPVLVEADAAAERMSYSACAP